MAKLVKAKNEMKRVNFEFDFRTLTIKDVKQKDSGQYMCQVNADPMVTQVQHF